jgi:hypothetical protein
MYLPEQLPLDFVSEVSVFLWTHEYNSFFNCKLMIRPHILYKFRIYSETMSP